MVSDFDSSQGTLTINKARVGGIDKDSTKTGEDRCFELCPRALQVLNHQLALREVLLRAGKIDHDHLFFKESGAPIRNLQYAALGFSLHDIGRLIRLRENPVKCSKAVRTLAQQKRDGLLAQLREIDQMQRELSLLLNLCTGADDHCPILDELSKKASP